MFYHYAYVGKWIGHTSGIFHSTHMHIHEQGKWSFHKRGNTNVDKKS
jgi:hypothetical protein